MWIQVLWMFFLVDSMNYRIQKLFFFGFGNPKVTVYKCAETIQGRKLYEEIR